MKKHHRPIKKVLERLKDHLDRVSDEMQACWDAMDQHEYEDGICDGVVTPLQGSLEEWQREIASTIAEIEEA